MILNKTQLESYDNGHIVPDIKFLPPVFSIM
jgi:hypothetical protein